MNAFTLWIEKMGLRKSEVAKAMGVRDPAVAKYSKDGFWPSRHVALRIMRVTGGAVTPNDLLGTVSTLHSKEYRAARKAIRRAKAKAGLPTPMMERNAKIYQRWMETQNLTQVGAEYRLSRERIRQIIDTEEQRHGKEKNVAGTAGGDPDERLERRAEGKAVPWWRREAGEPDQPQGRDRGVDPQPEESDEI